MALLSKTLPSHNELANILSHISPDSYETWYKTFICCGREYHQDPTVFAICQSWAKSYANRNAQCDSQERTAFYKSSQRHDGVNIGWLIHEAKSGGYSAPKAVYDDRVIIGEVKRAKSIITSKIEESLGAGAGVSNSYDNSLALLNTVREVLNFWVFNAGSFATERVKFLKEHFDSFDELVPGASCLYFKALTSYCDYLENPELFDEMKFIEWGAQNVYGFDGSELHALCDTDLSGACAPSITSPAEAADKFNAAMKSSAIMVTGAKAQAIVRLCASFDSEQDKEAAENEIIKAINKLGLTIALGDSSLECINGKDVARISKERSIETFNPDTSKKVYVKTGMPVLDRYIYGYRRGNSTILAAHSGVGKTWYGVDAARNVLEDGGRVLFFSSEMAASEICQRFTNNIRSISDAQLQSMYECENYGISQEGNFSKVFFDVNCFFNAHPNLSIIAGKNGGLSVEQITQEIAVQSQSGPVDLVVVDYLQNLANDSISPRAQGWERIKDTMERLNQACRVNNCPMLLLAQLNNPNRKASGAAGEPNIYEVAGASDVVRDAAAVLLLYQVKETDTEQQDEIAPIGDGTQLRLIVGKSRFGQQTKQPLEITRDAGSRFQAN